MKTVFSIYQPGSGEHLAIEMLRAALGDELRVCNPGREPDCCSAAAKRLSEFERAGYRLCVQRCIDDGTLELPRSGELVLMQTRKPVPRALDRYGRDLAQSGREHSVELLQSWLACDALHTVDYWRKWSAAPRRFVLQAERLLDAPRETLEALLSDLAIDVDDAALARAAEVAAQMQAAAPRDPDSDPHYMRSYFAEFAALIADEAAGCGYPANGERKAAPGPVTTIYRARRALAERDYEAVLAILTPFVAVNAVEPDVRAMLGEALLETGREVEGRRALELALKARPDDFDAFAVLARHAYGLGLATEARGTLREAMTRRGGAERVRRFLEKSRLDAELLREFPALDDEPAVSRDAVVAGFTWILGRQPESDAVIEGHRRLHDDDDLRLSLLRSHEFRDFHDRFEAGEEHAPADGEPPTREDMLQALRWLLGRPLRSREEAEALLAEPTRAALRLKLVVGDEFKSEWRHVADSF
ncbi:MAG TPA: tetratricopeptide repeat protein [Rhizomicrobium sp.]|nr:tetratricopeptide repeat protein [Rhizomicrobium sp.]